MPKAKKIKQTANDATIDVEPVRLMEDRTGAVVASEWRDPDDTDRTIRVPRVVRGYKVRDYGGEIIDGDKVPADVRTARRAAYERFRRDAELAQGARPGYERLGNKVSGTPLYGPSEMQVAAMTRHRKACDTLGLFLGALVIEIAINGSSVSAYCRAHGGDTSTRRVTTCARFLSAMDVLAAYYDPPTRN